MYFFLNNLIYLYRSSKPKHRTNTNANRTNILSWVGIELTIFGFAVIYIKYGSSTL